MKLKATMFCSGCERNLPEGAFPPSFWRQRSGKCKVCRREACRVAAAKYRATEDGALILKQATARWRASHQAEVRKYEAQRTATPEGYFQSLVRKHSARNQEMPGTPPLDYNATFLVKLYDENPICSLTGLSLDARATARGCGNMDPWMASVDRIDQCLPYQRNNVRLTSLIGNIARNNWNDVLLTEAALHVLGVAEYQLRPGEHWVGANTRAPNDKGFLASYLAGSWSARDRYNRFRHQLVSDPINHNWVRSRLDGDALFGARMVWSEHGKHPLQPTCDRLDNDLPHVQSNCRIVPYFANLGMHRFANAEVEFRKFLRLICGRHRRS